MTEFENTDLNEIKKFSERADSWWDRSGEFKTLHDINSTRLKFIGRNINLKGLHVLDIGCGGGILTESIAKEGALIVGIDASKENIEVAFGTAGRSRHCIWRPYPRKLHPHLEGPRSPKSRPRPCG